ncbi:unnamed protein product, partial [Rotaria magnacalcarata]
AALPGMETPERRPEDLIEVKLTAGTNHEPVNDNQGGCRC